MFRYKIVACILLILSVFSFVLAAPVTVQEAHEARIDAVDRVRNVTIGSRKRAKEDESLAEEQGPSSSSYSWPLPSKYQGPPPPAAEDHKPLLAHVQGPSSSSNFWSIPSRYQGPSPSTAEDHKPLLAQVKGPSSSSNFWSIPSPQYQRISSTPNDASKAHPDSSSPSGESRPPRLSNQTRLNCPGTQRARLPFPPN